MKKLVYIVLFFCITANLSAQVYEVGISAGISYHPVTDLKSRMENNLELLPFEAKIINNFPPYLSFSAFAGMIFAPNASVGIGISSLSTGLRIFREDYSGIYYRDIDLRGFPVSIYMNFHILRKSWFFMDFNTHVGRVFSKINYHDYLKIYDEVVADESMSQTTGTFFVEPMLQFWHIKEKYSIGLSLSGIFDEGYDYSFKQYPKALNMVDYYYNSEVKWNGFRSQIILKFFL